MCCTLCCGSNKVTVDLVAGETKEQHDLMSEQEQFPVGVRSDPGWLLNGAVAVTTRAPTSHQRDLHLLPPLHLPTRMLLRGRRSSADLDTSHFRKQRPLLQPEEERATVEAPGTENK